jgi:hypothetical protein
MATLADLYNQIAATDQEIEKIAGEEAVAELFEQHEEFDEDTEKVAAEYDAAGRLMARAYFSEMLKEAAEDEKDEEKDEEDEEDKDKKKKKKLPPGMEAMMAEKKAALKQRMLEDPEFAQAMFERYGQTE